MEKSSAWVINVPVKYKDALQVNIVSKASKASESIDKVVQKFASFKPHLESNMNSMYHKTACNIFKASVEFDTVHHGNRK